MREDRAESSLPSMRHSRSKSEASSSQSSTSRRCFTVTLTSGWLQNRGGCYILPSRAPDNDRQSPCPHRTNHHPILRAGNNRLSHNSIHVRQFASASGPRSGSARIRQSRARHATLRCVGPASTPPSVKIVRCLRLESGSHRPLHGCLAFSQVRNPI